jgi:lipoyl(octanoyl) transferase
MARDAVLLDRAARTGESVFSIYSWRHPTLSFGRNQRARGSYDLQRLSERGIDVVRRPTGGRAILHHREITYSITAPVSALESLRDAYRRINAILLDGLERLGVNAVIASAGESRSLTPSSVPCFERPSEGEITAGGRKLVGSAQWREASAFLQHGSILVDDDQTELASFAAAGADEAGREPPAPATLRELLGRAPASGELAEAMFAAVRRIEAVEGSEISEDEIRADTLRRIPAFLDESWTWRR